MSDSTDQGSPVSISRNLREAVKAGLVNSNETVRSAIVASYVKEETDRRIKATTSVLEKIEATELDLRKIKPSYAGYSLDGKPAGEPIYTKEQTEAAKKSNEILARLTKALELALNDGDFSKVFEVAK